MRLLVCGGRNFGELPQGNHTWKDVDRVAEERRLAYKTLDDFHAENKVVTLVHGGARGADRVAHLWGETAHPQINIEVYHANWARDGKAAGPIRNQRMLDEGKPDMIIAFPGGVGTADMVRRAKAAGVKVLEISDGKDQSPGWQGFRSRLEEAASRIRRSTEAG